MAKTLEYDDNGAYFGYFIISLVSFFLIPLSLYIIKNYIIGKRVHVPHNRCKCRPCADKNHALLNKSKNSNQRMLTALFLILIWLLFSLFIKLILNNFNNNINNNKNKKFDPFLILGVDQDATVAEVKAAYRKLAVKSHPDRGGDVDNYILLTRAYKSLTDPIMRENFEKFGNPEGPTESSLGIALPAFLVDKKNSKIVLILYFLSVIVGLPALIIFYWYYNQKFYSDKLLNNTLQIFIYFIHHTPDMKWKRMLTILCACEELDNKHCKNLIIRQNDSKEIRDLVTKMKITPKKEACLNQNYCVKARALLFAHLGRLEISRQLKDDLEILLLKLMYLMSEFQMLMMGYMFRKLYNDSSTGPSLESFLTSLKLSAAIIQGMAISDSPLLQLPHFTDELIVQIQRKKKSVNNIQNFVALSEKDRSFLLKNLEDIQVEDIYSCIYAMPSLTVKSQIKFGDENKEEVEFYGVITVIIRVERSSLSTKFHTPQISSQVEPSQIENPNGEFDNIQKAWEYQKPVQAPPLYYVHSPSFPCFKKEGWWAFIINSYNQMVNVPIYFNFTTDVEYIKFQYQAPTIAGVSKYKCQIISDSYLDFTYSHDFSVSVIKPIPITEEEPQWEDLSEAEDKAVDPEVLTDTECKLTANSTTYD